MKKLPLVLVLLIGFAGIIFAWEPDDLTKFPSCMNEKSVILNFGIGHDFGANIGGNYIYVPPIRLSFDFNAALGEKKLPFFFGGLVGFHGRGEKRVYFDSYLNLGFRVGYHFNWAVDNLDTYAVTTTGWRVYTGDRKNKSFTVGDLFIFDVLIGARWFINDFFGFWAETGYSPFSWFNIGVAFKF